ncbi:MAG: DUF5655 domain-containing protein [Bacteroidia bacterium]
MCVVKDIGELFLEKPDHLVLAFDTLVSAVGEWQPQSYGASVNTIVFTNKRAWLIVRPMKQELDLKFYSKEILESDLIKKTQNYRDIIAYHIRIKEEDEVTSQLIGLLRKGFDYALQN